MAFLDDLAAMADSPVLKEAFSSFSEEGYTAAFSSFCEVDSPEGKYCLAYCYLNGKGVVKDKKKAFALFKEVAESGYVPAVAEAAQCYGYGIGTKVDDETAFALFMKAAEEGDPYGMSMVSMMYRNGDGVKRSNKSAEEWSERCEETGDLEDIEETGLRHLVSGNYILARLYLMRSAVMGSPVSAKVLECMYSFGTGVAKDDDEASDWADTAECNGWDEVTLEDLDGCEDWFSEYIDLDELAEE